VPISPAFPVLSKGRADLTTGALYAITGADGYLYYGQMCPNKQLAFFRFRNRNLSAAAALESPLMSRFFVALPSIGRALRSGHWASLGRFPIRPALELDPILVQWSVGTTTVSLSRGGLKVGETDAWDPKIQEFEVIAAYDAIFHVPDRLVADFFAPPDAFKVGGSVRRHRLMKEDAALRFPEQPWHKLPPNWVATSDA
jgi:hypothetical protein